MAEPREKERPQRVSGLETQHRMDAEEKILKKYNL